MTFHKLLVAVAAISTFSAVSHADTFWTCKYKGKSGSYYFDTDQVREVALNRAYSQCYASGDTPCSSAGCEKSLNTDEVTPVACEK